eukprot:scaffold44908_cov23-Tisochrysis_lutea.AAC.4
MVAASKECLRIACGGWHATYGRTCDSSKVHAISSRRAVVAASEERERCALPSRRATVAASKECPRMACGGWHAT